MAVCQDDLTEEERRIISRVLQRAEQMEAQEQDRIGRLEQQLDSMKLTARGDGVTSCLLCAAAFSPRGPAAVDCEQCRKCVCTHCSLQSPCGSRLVRLCRICSEEEEVSRRSGSWFFRGQPKQVFPPPLSVSPPTDSSAPPTQSTAPPRDNRAPPTNVVAPPPDSGLQCHPAVSESPACPEAVHEECAQQGRAREERTHMTNANRQREGEPEMRPQEEAIATDVQQHFQAASEINHHSNSQSERGKVGGSTPITVQICDAPPPTGHGPPPLAEASPPVLLERQGAAPVAGSQASSSPTPPINEVEADSYDSDDACKINDYGYLQ
ncbi:rabphilin-3A-like [Clupea harengus]|uniref:Rabphilin-3A-like n=1 Tax=Clupea harengus TaxID=7950 RepID=A0A6P8GEA3_CLUHA|nr:rabphilin-3A-like [Clupea harengus]